MNNYLSYGGGVNSTAMLLMMLDQGVDFEAVFIHHGTDWPETYHYVAGLQWWLRNNGFAPITILRPWVQGASSLIDHCDRMAMIPSSLRRWCTSKFKVRVLHKYYQRPCFENIGFDAGEAHRAKISSVGGVETRWPLIEAGVDRAGCIEIIKAHDLPIPIKSGCYICPFQRRAQWVELRRSHPDLFCRAQKLEAANVEARLARGKEPIYLDPGGRPLDALVREKEAFLFDEMEYPPCQCEL